ncbi:MAG: plasma-membrane proton-efflux P-type ATPase [Ignavibacteriae bacterium]|nr:plasma-membrane proton-efflux P-type ATPase [Ignavibacteriota bacterium]NOG99199.1 plasma-membrane proton-efflux P-type ATPase [Ignavibacteriota bacterium]
MYKDNQIDHIELKQREIYNELDTNKKGLLEKEAAEKLNKFGFNEITENKKSPLLKLLNYFWGPIPIMIETAAILSLIVHHYADFGIITALLFMNVIVGYWHDRKADHAIDMLKNKLALNARVLRDNNWKNVKARILVPGDIIRLRLGDIIPADVKLVEGEYLECDESALTGESIAAEKKLLDDAYSGAVVTRGEMTGVVTKTGMNTYFGKTAKLVDEANTKSHFEKAVIRIGNFLIVSAVILILLILIVSIFRHDNLMETLRFAMVLTVASIPVALPAILTITMAVGATNLAKKKAIVSKLSSIEELAGMDILCSDKTGTLTQNKLTVGKPKPVGSFTETDVFLYAALASRREDNDSIDNAVLNKAENDEELSDRLTKFKIKKFIPFDPVIKRTEAQIIDSDNNVITVSKGAPQVIEKLCSKNNKDKEELNRAIQTYAEMGYRIISAARKEENSDWQLAGLIPLFDPPREDAAETIKKANAMGVDVKMITGDNTAIAKQISKKLGIKSNIVDAGKLTSLNANELEELVETSDGFAQVFPEHKFSIVSTLQKLKHIVGMTGDGVNDAPALKKSDCGIAVAGATDAAKSAAAIVLTSPGISIIIDAIKESRKIFQRMTSYSIYRIAETVRVLLFLTLSILAFNFYPVTAVMIVLLALLNDAPIIAIATDNAKYSLKPERWNMHEVLGLGTMLGIAGVIFSFLIFYIGRDLLQLSAGVLQSFIFLKLAIAGHLTIFVARTRDHFWSNSPSRTLVLSAIATKILATVFAVYGWFISPIGWQLALFVWGYAIASFILTDFIKVFFYKHINSAKMITT